MGAAAVGLAGGVRIVMDLSLRILAASAAVAVGFLVVLFLVPWIRRKTKAGAASGSPRDFHQMHRTPVCRLGGVALASVFCLVSLGALVLFPAGAPELRTRLLIVVGALGMFGLGLADDLRPIGGGKKLLGQVLIALIFCLLGKDYIEVLRNPLTGAEFTLGGWAVVVTVFWLVAMTNLINLIDGIDGLAAGVSLMLMVLLAWVAWTTLAAFPAFCLFGMCGALVAFLRYNYPPARIYLGDGGAYLLGFLIAAFSVVQSQKGTVAAALVAPLFALALPIIDATLAILRRALRGLPVFRADRKHIHHTLQADGLSTHRTVLILYGVSLVFLVLAFVVVWTRGRTVPAMVGLLSLLAVLAVAGFKRSRGWLTWVVLWNQNPDLREGAREALVLSRWLVMEAERSDSLDALWEDFLFLARNVGFSGVTVVQSGEQRSWRDDSLAPGPEPLECELQVGGEAGMAIKFSGSRSRIHPEVFDVACELAAEAWHQAWRHFQARGEAA